MAKGKQEIPMTSFEPQQAPYAPAYSAPYAPPYPPQSYGAEPYDPKAYPPGDSTPLPYAPSGTDTYCCDCPFDPPPYTCEEVPCDEVGPVSMANNPPVVVAGIFSSKPASTICPCCRQIITTEIVYRVGSLTYAVCTAMCMMGGCMGCCLIPFMTNCCKDVDHYCPSCHYHIYRYKKL